MKKEGGVAHLNCRSHLGRHPRVAQRVKIGGQMCKQRLETEIYLNPPSPDFFISRADRLPIRRPGPLPATAR